MLIAFLVFLGMLGLMLIACAIYIRLPTPGARRTDAAPIVVTPTLPRAICIPTAHRRKHPDVWPCS